jgi:mono/diheme cytochrome c family protein
MMPPAVTPKLVSLANEIDRILAHLHDLRHRKASNHPEQQRRPIAAAEVNVRAEMICMPWLRNGLGIRSARTFCMMLVTSAAIASFPSIPKAQEGPIIPDEPGKAEPKVGDPQRGLVVARALCATCHLIGESPQAPVPSDVPSFRSIANRPNQTAQALANWLIEPHTPMPNIHLTREEIRDLSAYVLTLRAPK